METKILIVTLETGYCGSDKDFLIRVKEGFDVDDLDEALYNEALDNASMYGYEMCYEGDYCEDDECEYEHPGSSNIDFSYREYNPEKDRGSVTCNGEDPDIEDYTEY